MPRNKVSARTSSFTVEEISEIGAAAIHKDDNEKGRETRAQARYRSRWRYKCSHNCHPTSTANTVNDKLII